jgi:hypothetical protein
MLPATQQTVMMTATILPWCKNGGGAGRQIVTIEQACHQFDL